MHIPGVVGEWSVKDILAHVSTWEEESLKYLPQILEEKKLPRYKDLYGGIDAFNAIMTEKNRELTIGDVFNRLDNTHQQLVEYIKGAPDDQIATETRFRRRIRLETFGHYPEHTAAILKWRVKQSV